MKFLSILLSLVILCGVFFSPFSMAAYDYIYCRECGKKILSDSNYCTYCGTKVTDSNSQSTVYQLVPSQPKSYSISYDRSDRTVVNSFKDTKTAYNVFPDCIPNCYGCHFYYSASRSNGSSESCTGTRDVYVRGYLDEVNDEDCGWIYVGSFEYDKEGKAVEVDLSWYDTEVYAVAVVREKTSNGCSFSASWGDKVTFYFHE